MRFVTRSAGRANLQRVRGSPQQRSAIAAKKMRIASRRPVIHGRTRAGPAVLRHSDFAGAPSDDSRARGG